MTLHIHYPETENPIRETYTVVVDGADLVPGGCDSDSPSPKQQIDVLQRLVKIQKVEAWEMWVLFNGEPLEQVDHGGDFLGVRVFFSPTPPQRVPTLLECIRVLKRKDRDALLVTNDGTAEARAKELGALTLRADTLKKGHEPLFIVQKRTQSRLMRHRTVDRKKSQLDQDPDIRDMIDLVE
jgi:hypothetical protein